MMKNLLDYYDVTSSTLRITYLFSFLSVLMGLSGHTMGSNPTLSARTGMKAADFSHSEKVTYKCTYKCLRSGGRKAVGSLSAMIHWEEFSTVPCIHKSRSVSSGWSTSALLPKADIGQRIKHVCVTLKRAKCSGKLHPSARRRLPPAFVLELTIAESKRAGSAFKEISP